MQATPRHAAHWFEIPVRDLDRAQAFYEAVLAAPLRREAMGPQTTLAVLPYDEGGVGGCLMAGATAPAPSASGTLVYLDAGPAIDALLARVEPAGGRIATPKVALPEGMGFFAHIVDPDGNCVGVHAMA